MRFRLLVLLLSAAVLVSYLIPPHRCPLNYPADDAFFYLQVASQVYEGNGTTFNQITPTNGYHPLWMLCCIGLFHLVGGNHLAALHAAIGVQQFMGLGAVVLFLYLARRLSIRRAFLALPVLFLFFSTRLYASEAYVNGLFLLLTLWSGLILCGKSARNEPIPGIFLFASGCCAGLTLLARLDNVFVIGCFMSACVWFFGRKTDRRPRMRPLLLCAVLMAAGCLAVFGPYLAYNKITFGHWAPVSGAIKSTLPNLVFNPNGLSGIGKLCAVVAVLGMAAAWHPRQTVSRRFMLLVLSGGVLLHSAQIVFTTSHHTNWPWYYVAGVINLSFCLALAADWLAERRGFRSLLAVRMLLPFTLMAVVVVNGYAELRYRSSAPTIRESFEPARLKAGADLRWQQRVAEWLRGTLPPGTGVAVYDWPGMFAYTSGLAILPIDGLINDYQYNDDVLREGIAAFLEKRGVQYWLGPADPLTAEPQVWYSIREADGEMCVEVMAPLYMKSAGCFCVESSGPVARLRDVIPHPDLPDLALWRIR